jgi:hypothetical protein
VGQLFPATISRDVMNDADRVVIPRGTEALLVIRQSDAGNLVLALNSVNVDDLQIGKRRRRRLPSVLSAP